MSAPLVGILHDDPPLEGGIVDGLEGKGPSSAAVAVRNVIEADVHDVGLREVGALCCHMTGCTDVDAEP